MRVGLSCQLVRDLNFGVGNCIVGLAQALARSSALDGLVLYVPPGCGLRHFGWADPVGRTRLVRSPVATEWRPLRVVWEQVFLPVHARSDRLDVLHSPGYVQPARLRLPSVLSVYDILVQTHPEFCKVLNRLHYRWRLGPSVRQAARIIVPARAVRDQLCERFDVPAERIRVIPPGIRSDFRRPISAARVEEIRSRYALPARFVLFVGSLEPKKNLARLIGAHRSLWRRGFELELVLAGGAGWGVPGEALEGLGVRSIGFVRDEDLPALYRAATVVALPSLAEGFGIPVVEAMAVGTPVVASDVPAVLDTDPDAVVRIDPSSTHSIAEGLVRAVDDSDLRRQLRERGLVASRRLSWEEAAARTCAVYEEAAYG